MRNNLFIVVFASLVGCSPASVDLAPAPALEDPALAATLTTESTGLTSAGTGWEVVMLPHDEVDCTPSIWVTWSEGRLRLPEIFLFVELNQVYDIPPEALDDHWFQQEYLGGRFPWPDGTAGSPGDGQVWTEVDGDDLLIGVQTTIKCYQPDPFGDPLTAWEFVCEDSPLDEIFRITWADPTQRNEYPVQGPIAAEGTFDNGLCFPTADLPG